MQKIVIDDSNFQSFCGPYRHDGKLVARGYRGSRNPAKPMALRSRRFEDLGVPLIDPNLWDDIARQRQRDQATLENFINDMKIPCQDQNGYPFCWAYALVHGLEVMRVQETMTVLDYCVESLVARVTNWNKRGGWGSEAAEGAAKWGCNTTEQWPHLAWDRSLDSQQNRDLAAKHLLIDYVVLGDAHRRDVYEQAVSLLLSGWCLAGGHNWWAHEILHTDYLPGGAHRIRNSWKHTWGENGFGNLEGTRQLADEFVAFYASLAA